MKIYDILESIAGAAAANIIVDESDYVGEDGLLYCVNCKTPKQCKVAFSGSERVVFCMCKCQTEKAEREKECRLRQEEADRISNLKSQGIQDKAIRAWTFANDDGSNQPTMDKAMRYYSKWQQMYKDNVGLLLWGDVGTGKTYFAACIANGLLDRGTPVLMTNFSKIINALSGFENDRNQYISSFDRYKLLIIDDLGAERQSEFAQEIVYNVIDARYKNHQPLIITTNMTLDEIKNPKDMTCSRIYDRILEMSVPIHFKGNSRRRVKYQSNLAGAKALLGD